MQYESNVITWNACRISSMQLALNIENCVTWTWTDISDNSIRNMKFTSHGFQRTGMFNLASFV